MPRIFLSCTAAALALATPAFASEAASKAQVLEAIRTFEANAVGGIAATRSPEQASAAVARASNLILRYALESSDVVVDLGADSVPWCDVKKGLSENQNAGQRGLLLAAYVSGCVSAQLRSGKRDPNPLEGWVAMLRVYRAMRIREGTKIPEIEALLARQMNGSLDAYAASALTRSTERLRARYGAPAKPDSPTLASQP
ncbi:MAG TPA: hypothetical protein VKG78_05215 [Opitutaceae bacterium]|nr:hypothetical protein [Opitutaceae bacterium]